MRVVLSGLIYRPSRAQRSAREVPLLLTSLAADYKKNWHLQRDIRKEAETIATSSVYPFPFDHYYSAVRRPL